MIAEPSRGLQGSLVGDRQTPMLILFGATGLLLLIACVNATNLLLARPIRGFVPERVATPQMTLDRTSYPRSGARLAMLQRLLDRLRERGGTAASLFATS